MLRKILAEIKLIVVLTIVLGILYPIFMTGIGMGIFKDKANGSLIVKDGKVVGSKYIGQEFNDDIHMKSRPSAVSYNIMDKKDSPSSGSSNTSITRSDFIENTQKLAMDFKKKFDVSYAPIDIVTESGSGLDPHISYGAALLQLESISNTKP